MRLDSLLKSLDYKLTGATTKDKEIRKLAYHSDEAAAESVFFAAAGRDTDGSFYIKDALDKGCRVIVTEKNFSTGNEFVSGKSCVPKDVSFIQVGDVRHAMASMASKLYGEPSKKLFVIGVTGTKGKSGTAYMIWRILEKAGVKSGIIGTVFTGFEGALEESEHTTPESVDLQRQLKIMQEAGCKAAVIEVSSQGIMQRRTDFVDFDLCIFTNMSSDHIGRGEHSSYEEYRYWKSRLFRQCRMALMNIDDAESSFMAKAFADGRSSGSEEGKDSCLMFFGRSKEADFCIDNIELWSERGCLGVKYTLRDNRNRNEPAGNGVDLNSLEVFAELPGDFNAYNSAAAIATAGLMGIPFKTSLEVVKNIKIPGRTEIVPVSEKFTAMVDYAHNGAALRSLLKNLRRYRHERLITVFGCGGDRDRSRRAEMGEAASELSDVIIVTSDNPRTEDPMKIIEDITGSISPDKTAIILPDRRTAIRKALEIGREGDIIVVAGKGHETYQITGGERRRFDDREELLSLGKEIL